MKFREVFQTLIERFQREQIEYALVGAFALKAYGYVRATQDIDFLVRTEVQDKVVAYVESLGYETLHQSGGFSNHIHSLSNLGRIDFVYVKGDTADKIFSQTKRILVLGDLSLPVASPEHLVALKVFAMKNDPERRFKELADIKFLLSIPGIDKEAVRHSFEKYGQLERYDELIEKED